MIHSGSVAIHAAGVVIQAGGVIIQAGGVVIGGVVIPTGGVVIQTGGRTEVNSCRWLSAAPALQYPVRGMGEGVALRCGLSPSDP